MTEELQNNSSGFRHGFGRFMRGLAKLLLFVLIVALVVVAIYYAVPYVYSYMVLPAQNNRVVIDQIQDTQEQMQETFTGQLAEQSERIAQLETDLAAEREVRSELETLLDQQVETIQAQATAISALQTSAETQAEGAAVQTELAGELQTQGQSLSALEEEIEAVDASVAELDRMMDRVLEIVTDSNPEVVSLQRQTLALQGSQAVLKARLHLSENNPGQALDSLEQIVTVLEQLADVIPPEQEDKLAEIEVQLEAVTTAIEEQPFIATQELEILWQLLQNFSED
jgi:chromosome segregation ATPase